MKTFSEIKNILSLNKNKLKKKYKIKELGAFGSYVKDKQKKSSDIDILVEFKKDGETFDNYMELKFFLEDALKTKIDLVIKDTLKEDIKEDILSEAIYV